MWTSRTLLQCKRSSKHSSVPHFTHRRGQWVRVPLLCHPCELRRFSVDDCASLQYCGWESELGFRLSAVLLNESEVIPSPNWVAADSYDHPNKKTDESETGLALAESMIVLKYERECLCIGISSRIQAVGYNACRLAPKNRYSMPSNNADNRHKFRHICSKKSSWNGRIQLHRIVLDTDLFIFSIGALHASLPVSFRNRTAFSRSSTGWYYHV